MDALIGMCSKITASESENEQRSGRDVRRCIQSTFVKLETPSGEPSSHPLAVLLRSECPHDHPPAGESAPKFHRSRMLYRGLANRKRNSIRCLSSSSAFHLDFTQTGSGSGTRLSSAI